MWQKLSRSYPPQLELVALFLVFATFYLAAANYPSLPERIPTHFNFQGVPDGWGGKGEIFVFPVLSAALYVLFTVINILFAVVKDPRRLINLPQKRKAALTEAQVEQLRLFFSRSLFGMKLLLQGLLAYSVYITVEVAHGRATGLGAPWFLLLAGILVVAGYMVWRSFRLTAKPGRP